LPIAVIEPPFRALLVATVGTAPLPAPGGGAAGGAAVAVPAIAMRADEKHRPAVAARTNPLPQNRFAVRRHVLPPAALDNSNSFVAPCKPAWCVTSLKVAHHGTSPL